MHAYIGIDEDHHGDGLPDAWESLYGTSATSMNPGDDLNGDGYLNIEEYLNGTTPR